MNLIATHDSATGEKGYWWSIPLIPFARTQSKTVLEQYNAGCRLFDIRVRKYKSKWHCAHGLWVSKDTVFSIIKDVCRLSTKEDPVYMTITYEGKYPNIGDLEYLYKCLKVFFPETIFCYLAIKYGDNTNPNKPHYKYLERGYIPPNCQAFKQLDGRSWHTYLPIPWLWKRIYYYKPIFNRDIFTYVDFL